MKVWIFNPFDDVPGEGAPQRYWTLADALSAMGHDVVWWSSEWSHRRKAMRTKVVESEGQGFDLRLVPAPAYFKNVSFARMRNHRTWGKNLYREARRAVDSGVLATPDLILASLPPMEAPMVALDLGKEWGCRTVTDLMDAWPETLHQASPLPAAINRAVFSPYTRMLKKACRQSHAISAQSAAFANYGRENGAAGEGHVCYLGADSRDLKTGERTCSDASSTLRLLYLGAMGRSYDLETIVDALKVARGEGVPVECAFVGDGEKRQSLEARSKDLPGIRFTGYLRGEALENECERADLGLVPFFSGSGVAVPYKACDYLSYGLPLLSTIDGELGDFIRRYGCGSIYREADPKSLLEVIRTYASDPELVRDARRSALLCFRDQFDRAKIYPEFARWLTCA